MTTILLEEDIKLKNNTFRTKNDLLLFLLEESEDVVLWNEMNNLINNSSNNDFVSYENFILNYKNN